MSVLAPLDDPSGPSVRRLLEEGDPAFLYLALAGPAPGGPALDRMAQVLAESGAGLVYADSPGRARVDYQPGSLRDDFDFGPVVGISQAAAREACDRCGWPDERLRWGGFYDLRLKIAERHPIVRIPEPLFGLEAPGDAADAQFAYVDPRNREYQAEMEEVATAHLKRIGAYLAPEFETVPGSGDDFPAAASVVIPVRNRARTIAESVGSALAQKAPFAFNVLVVDNHSEDGTGEILRGIGDPRLIRLVPDRKDLGIGGCWDLAVRSGACGRYAVQLDSDDLYRADDVLARLVDRLRSGPFAMVVGAYSLVDFSLRPIPPGLVDHREWTRDNGRNNLLRVGGLGAPRAYDVAVLRRFSFPNVSYGEDYAVGLRVSRDHEIGRLFESVYLCRRWEGNSDSALPAETRNRYDSYKDWLRTVEIHARRRKNGGA